VKIDELETNSKTKNIQDLDGGINDSEKGYQPRTNIVKYEKGVVYVLLGISPASICNMPTFRNHVSVPSSKAESRLCGVRKGEALLHTVYFQPLKMELIHGSETSAYYILAPGKYPKEHIQYSYHGESLKSTI